MSPETVGVLVIISVFILMFLRVPIVLSMAMPAFFAIMYLKNEKVLFTAIESIAWDRSYNYTLSTIPLFVLMGQFLFQAG
ncbi:MAG: TRAP transporter large permease subunit, partial [Solibacillus isronensis]